jgi:uncharacterized protein YjiS (DUF1127 family)
MSKVGNGIDLDDDFEDDDFEDDDSDDSSDDDTIDLSDDDDDSDTSDTAIRRIAAHVPPSPKAGANARRRVEDYLEMRRAARELKELDDFDFLD